ncbi:metallophosphoesterase family protein [Bifidobacterium sp. SO1]|uniref:metallophosphoesterase family protein n=1 Tax=Bifidobacterium sp. SO1 TaxID=2809029 RepID=UPI001BDD3B61|nr:metallophosphoesterase family protein [Bifidobacterium sp. SO1]MBT1161755.1 metallophosphoesterase [Bifidobacterium sp. SO1]
MSRSLIVGDLHAKPDLLPLIGTAAGRCHADRIILLGDLCDDWTLTNREQIRWVECFIDWYRREPREIIPLIGNHDIPYLLGMNDTFRLLKESIGFPGYRPGAKRRVHELLSAIPFRIAWTDGRMIATHAGLTRTWLETNMPDVTDPMMIAMRLNEWMTVPGLATLYRQVGAARGGDSPTPSPLWTDRSELTADHDSILIQAVGHTPVPTVTHDRGLFFCDTMSTDSNGTPIGDRMMLLADGNRYWPVPIHAD